MRRFQPSAVKTFLEGFLGVEGALAGCFFLNRRVIMIPPLKFEFNYLMDVCQ